ncbi:hypothetical protein C0992_009781 [Termitomyces sp. T32_za158]|nr:hypothetical protein C0992_009781 [Termitomyces sp. T32_za158]
MGGGPTTIFFVNELPSDCEADIKRIDEQGNRTNVTTAKGPGDSYCWLTTTYPHQPWEVVFSFPEGTFTRIFYAAPHPSRVRLDADIVPAPGLDLMDPSLYSNLVSPNEGAYTTMKFENHLQTNVKIFSVDPAGALIPYETIYPGASSIQSTYVGCTWKVFGEHDASPFAIFRAMPGGIARFT